MSCELYFFTVIVSIMSLLENTLRNTINVKTILFLHSLTVSVLVSPTEIRRNLMSIGLVVIGAMVHAMI